MGWPGNIRELENFMERSVILTPGAVLQAPLSELQTVVDQGKAAMAGPFATKSVNAFSRSAGMQRPARRTRRRSRAAGH